MKCPKCCKRKCRCYVCPPLPCCVPVGPTGPRGATGATGATGPGVIAAVNNVGGGQGIGNLSGGDTINLDTFSASRPVTLNHASNLLTYGFNLSYVQIHTINSSGGLANSQVDISNISTTPQIVSSTLNPNVTFNSINNTLNTNVPLFTVTDDTVITYNGPSGRNLIATIAGSVSTPTSTGNNIFLYLRSVDGTLWFGGSLIQCSTSGDSMFYQFPVLNIPTGTQIAPFIQAQAGGTMDPVTIYFFSISLMGVDQ